MIHTVKGFSVVNEAEVDVFVEFSHFSCDPVDVGNLISGSSTFSKSSLNIWKFSVHILLKPGLENLEHNFPSVWNEAVIKIIPKKKKCKQAKWLSEEGLQIAERRREAKAKERRKAIPFWCKGPKNSKER